MNSWESEVTSILEINVNETSYVDAITKIQRWAHQQESRYVCVANVHMLMEAHDSDKFRKVVNNADLVTPDGMPLVWMMRMRGIRSQQRVYGPTLMLCVLEHAHQKNIPVGFYGGSPEVLKKLVKHLQTRYENLNIVFLHSPPYRALDNAEDLENVMQINHSGARILFVGLGCPKQEIWMAEHRGVINSVMIGVGAAFDFHAGVKPQAPGLMQRLGLEWLFRLVTEPRRLWKRYLRYNPRFIFLAIADLLGLLKKID
jgi:N-acetylglucosaminyldiphosphoundecaprenol N-acetyl-beta-D-mannosaminyltransferase